MRSLRKKLLVTIVGVVCLSVAFLATTPASAASAHAASAHTASNHTLPLTSGGGCWRSGDGRVVACVSINSRRIVLSDAYIDYHCATSVYIQLDDDTNGYATSVYYRYGGCGHFSGPGQFMTSGHKYSSWVHACFSDIGCEWQRSPEQYA